jgi:hypothetical protein
MTISVKTLGITWNPTVDKFAIVTEPIAMCKQTTTKKTVLSDVVRIFVPLDIAGPIIVTAKMLLQCLWQKQLDWDEPLDVEDDNNWKMFRNQLMCLHTARQLMSSDFVMLRLPHMVPVFIFIALSRQTTQKCPYCGQNLVTYHFSFR